MSVSEVEQAGIKKFSVKEVKGKRERQKDKNVQYCYHCGEKSDPWNGKKACGTASQQKDNTQVCKRREYSQKDNKKVCKLKGYSPAHTRRRPTKVGYKR